METTETILIKGEDGTALRINASDFKVGKHEFFEEQSDAGNGSSGGNDGQSGQPAPGQPQQPAQQPGTPAGAPRGAAKPA